MSSDNALTDQDTAILRLLYQYRQLPTTAIRQAVAASAPVRSFRRELERLEGCGYVAAYRERGGENLWRLTAPGGRAIGREVHRAHYRLANHAVQVYRQREAALVTTAQNHGFIVYRGTPASPLSAVRALQNETRQVVVKHWKAREKADIATAEAAGAFVAQRKTQLAANVNPVPLIFREWYFHRPNVTGFIGLVARRDSPDYWKKRLGDMTDVGKLLPVVCLFGQMPPADLHAALNRAGFQIVRVADFAAFLDTFGRD